MRRNGCDQDSGDFWVDKRPSSRQLNNEVNGVDHEQDTNTYRIRRGPGWS
jgi:hypothetical protein